MGSIVSMGAYTWISALLLTVVNAALVGAVGWFLIRFLLNTTARFLKKTKIDPLLHSVILSVAKIGMLVLLAISVLEVLGIPTASIITSLGAVGLAISLAVKDSIATLAGGVVILLLKPFTLGDYVEIGGIGGTVQEITMFSTVLTTTDNKRISLPNDSVSKANVINYSAEPNRRLDLVFTIGYNDDYDKARAVIEKVIRDCPLALEDPAPVVRMSGHGASSIEITTRVWVKNADYYELKFQMYEKVKKAFDQKGLIYGMGHAVYSISDPRADIFKSFVKQLASEKGYEKEYALYDLVERLAPEIIAEKRKIYKGVNANVDFYSGLVYGMLGLPQALYTPIFAAARIVGWSAHRLEELKNVDKIIRPAYKALAQHRDYVKMEDR